MHAERTRAGADARPVASIRARAVVIAGPPASGKTTLGAALAGALHYAFIDLDIVTGTMTRAALALSGAEETALDGELGAGLRDARYGALLDTTVANLNIGLGVVLSGPFTRERTDPARWEAIRERLGGTEVPLICLSLEEPLRSERMRARGATRDRSKLGRDAAAARACACEEPTSTTIPGAIRLDGDAHPNALLEAALTALDGTAGSFRRPEPEQTSPRSRC